jgi:hypothetical protein
MLINPHYRQIITAANMSGALLSEPIDLSGNDGYSVQASWTGVTGSGVLSLQASAHKEPTAGQWVQIASSPFSVTSAQGNDMWNITAAKYKWAQLIWTPDIGGATGALSAVAFLK